MLMFGGFNTVKIPIIPKAVYLFIVIPLKTSKNIFFMELEHIILKFVWNHERHWIGKVTLKKNEMPCFLMSNYIIKP